jgi:pentatricopeptide repeat-containing protein PET309
MLERASTCLESGGRQLFRAPKPCLRSRRILHPPLRHHGASDVTLSPWQAASPIIENTHDDVHDGAAENATTDQKPHEGVLLEFLYPEKTLALLGRLSASRPKPVEPRRQQPHTLRVRHFSTIQAQMLHDQALPDVKMVEHSSQEAAELLRGSDAYTELQKLLKKPPPEKQELAWQLYSAIPKDLLASTRRVKVDLLKYLIQDGGPAVPERVLQVFAELRPAARRLSSYRAAIKAYVALGMIGPAIQLFDELAHPTDLRKSLDPMRGGMDSILRRVVLDEQWDLAFRVFRTFRRQTRAVRGHGVYTIIRIGDTLPEIWGEVAQLPELLEHFQSFLRYVREFQHELTASQNLERDLACFVMSFVPHVIDRVLHTKGFDEDFIWDYFIRLFDDLQSLRLPTSVCYEYAIKQMLLLPRYRDYTNQRKIPLELYRRYRQLYLAEDEPTSDAKPSESLIRELIFQHSTKGGLGRVQDHVQDLRAWYPHRLLRPGLLRNLIITYANVGDVERVHEYVDELRSSHPDEVTIRVLSSLLYVHARRADIDGTITQFKRIHEEFHMTPDTACWNILLLAYVRAEDLDGALECFNNCLEYGVTPDVHTFGTLLDFCAHRGDVEAFETLFSRAKQMGIQLDMDVRARSGYVEAFLNAGDPEGAEAIAHGMLNSWMAGRLHGHPLSHTWNLLIQQRAMDRDLAGARQTYRQMVQNNIPLDSWTYGSLMRALIEVKQTNAAYKLLRVTMPEQGYRVHALHYAIVMTGFLREGQYDLAVDAYERMKARKVPQTKSSRQVSLEALGMADQQKLKKRGAKDPNYRLLRVEEALDEMLVTSTFQEIAHRQPEHERLDDVHSLDDLRVSYYGLMISLYSARSAYRICKKLFEKAAALTSDSGTYAVPLTLVTSMMEAHLKGNNHEEVAKFWDLARSSAVKLVKTFHQAVQKRPEPLPETTSLLDPIIQERFQESHISNNRRQILAKPSRIYIRSLLLQSDAANPSAIQEVQNTIRDLLANGFTVDSLTWNEFIQQLVLRNRIVDAFTICEEFLMPRFPGWRELIPNFIRRDIKGFQWMELRPHDIKKSTVLPRYKTMVLLAKAFGEVKSDERNGIGYDAEAEAWLAEILENRAPLTVRAIESMPRTFDKLQQGYFNGML